MSSIPSRVQKIDRDARAIATSAARGLLMDCHVSDHLGFDSGFSLLSRTHGPRVSWFWLISLASHPPRVEWLYAMASLTGSIFAMGALSVVTLTLSGCGTFTCSEYASVTGPCTYTCKNGKTYTIDYLFEDNSCCFAMRDYYNDTVCERRRVSDDKYCRVSRDCSDCTQSSDIQKVVQDASNKKCNNGVTAQAAAAFRVAADAASVIKRVDKERLEKIRAGDAPQEDHSQEQVIV